MNILSIEVGVNSLLACILIKPQLVLCHSFLEIALCFKLWEILWQSKI
ncbi:hypothetical protein CWATWH8502_4922 [Crocosphaera watsonii WH 8502]|uniref:Uncharacterized protein n=1 Tax=Crocosphaera watsonii WH 8502 TaxID=423474 RepID=T2I8W0_CROWT|nr:hypothetical protein CWATWH8502_4922 [Crocosphaera watsonii WH 8502]